MKNFFSTIFLIFAVVLLISSSEAAMDLSDLREWIVQQRAEVPRDVEKDLLLWPENKWGKCSGFLDYFGRLGQEFTNLCGAVLRENVQELGGCATDLTTVPGVLNSARVCADKAESVFAAWRSGAAAVGTLTKCTLTAYIVAGDMTGQQREDWITFINGLDDLSALFSLSEIFQEGDIGTLGAVSAPKPSRDPAQLLDNIETVKKDMKQRAKALGKAPEQLGSVKAALLTIAPFKNSYFRQRRDDAVGALKACRLDEAMDIYTMTKLQVVRQIGSLRAAVVLAEDQFYCTALNINFHKLSFQNEFLNGTYYTGGELNALKKANREQRAALELYEQLVADPELSAGAFRKVKAEKERVESKVKPLLDTAQACIESCGKLSTERPRPAIPIAPVSLPPGVSQIVGSAIGANRTVCTLPLDTLVSGLESYSSYGSSRCAEAVMAEQNTARERLNSTLMAKNRATEILDRYRGAVQPLLDACNLDSAKIQTAWAEMDEAMRRDQRAYGFPNAACYNEGISDMNARIADRRRSCGGNAATGNRRPATAFFVVSVRGSGYTFTPWDGTYQISGSEEQYFQVQRGQSVQEKLEDLKRSIDGDPCQRAWAGRGGGENTHPRLFTSGSQITIIDGPYFHHEELIRAHRELKNDWRLSGKKGPHPLDMRRTLRCQ
ncbi:MAG: hypothetical protein ACYC69_08995 [Thermodesulfovibrionales bacterium]